MVELGDSWALLVSLWRDNQLEHTVALVGTMSSATDGSPELSLRSGGRVDEGRSLYAPQVALDPDGPWFLGWVMQVGVTGEVPEDAVAGCLTLVRRLYLEEGRVLSRVDSRQARLLGEPLAVEDGAIPAYAHVAARGDAVTLRGNELSVTLQPGAEAWLDGEVLEVYPPDAPPRTYRDLGTAVWSLTEGMSDATVREVRSRG